MMPAQTWTLSSPNSLLRVSSLQAARVLNMPGWLSATHSSSAVCNKACQSSQYLWATDAPSHMLPSHSIHPLKLVQSPFMLVLGHKKHWPIRPWLSG